MALSGGKDSVTTLEILNTFREMNVIDICAVTVDEGIANYREEGIEIARRHAERLGIEHKVVSLKEDYGITLDEIMQRPNHKGSCSYCGVFRRTIINKATGIRRIKKLTQPAYFPVNFSNMRSNW